MPETSTEIITDTLRFMPHKIQFPATTIDDHLKIAVDNIITLLSDRIGNTLPLQKQSKEVALRNGFTDIAKILQHNISTHIQQSNIVQSPRVLQTYNPLYGDVRSNVLHFRPTYNVVTPRVNSHLILQNPHIRYPYVPARSVYQAPSSKILQTKPPSPYNKMTCLNLIG